MQRECKIIKEHDNVHITQLQTALNKEAERSIQVMAHSPGNPLLGRNNELLFQALLLVGLLNNLLYKKDLGQSR